MSSFSQHSFNNNRILIILSIGLILISLETIFIQKQNEILIKQEKEVFAEIKTEKLDIDISSWLTYRNEEYGFEFRYPREWRVKEDKNTIVFKPIDANPTQPIDFGIRVYISLNEFWDFNGEKTIEEYITTRIKNGVFKELKKIQINNTTAISFKEYSDYLSSNLQKILFEKGKYIFEISFGNDIKLKNNEAYQIINNSILKNFYF